MNSGVMDNEVPVRDWRMQPASVTRMPVKESKHDEQAKYRTNIVPDIGSKDRTWVILESERITSSLRGTLPPTRPVFPP